MSEEQLIKTPGVFGENGNFLLERELGRGGMGGVYLGRDKMLDRPVAMKVMLKEYGSDAAFVEKFKKEAQAAARLIHPNIAQIYSYGISDGMPYIAMELVAGGSLDGLMKTQGANIDVPRVMKIIEQVAQALRCAADQGLVHGDVKPENVLLDANGNAKLVDFGLAAMQNNTDEIWGTPYYIAPEKVKKEPVDYRADMYSLGGTLYHALTGVAPFEGEDAAAVVRKRFEGEPKKPSEVRSGLSPQIDALVMRMLALEPQDRYPTFEALLADLKAVMTTGLSSTQSVAAAAAAGAAAGATKTAGRTATGPGGKKLVLKSKKKFKINTASTAASEDEDVADLNEGDEASADGGASGLKRLKPKLSNGAEDSYEDEEGGVGGKVALVIGAVILAIALVGGGLWYLTYSDKRSAEKEQNSQTEKNYDGIKKNLETLDAEMTACQKQLEGIVKGADAAVESSQKKIAKRMSEVYPDSFVKELKPNPPQSEQTAPAAETNAAPAQATAAAPSAVAAAPIPVVPKFRAPEGDETDPNSPEGQKYKEEKEAWEKEQAEKAKAAAEAPAVEPTAEEETAEEEVDENKLDRPLFIDKFRDVWKQVYDAQAALIEIKGTLDEIRTSKEALLESVEKREEEPKKLESRQKELLDSYKNVKNTKPYEMITKIRARVESDCGKIEKECDQTVKRIKEKQAEKEAKEAEAKRLAEKEERQRKEMEELREKEVAQVDELYQSICEGPIRQLDWRSATNRLVNLQRELKSDRGERQAEDTIKRIQMMASVQEILQRNLKGHTFKKDVPKNSKTVSIRNFTVESVTDSEFVVVKDGKKKRITWRKFYSDYYDNFVEVLNIYVRHGMENGNPKLKPIQRAQGMIGIALTFNVICADNARAQSEVDRLLKDAVVKFPGIKETVTAIFPELDLSDIEEAAERSNL